VPTFLAKAACFTPLDNKSGQILADALTTHTDLLAANKFHQAKGEWARIEGTVEGITTLRATLDLTRPSTLKGLKVAD